MRVVVFCFSSIALVSAPLVASAQELFDQAVTLPVSGFTNYIQLVDLDMDGDLDIIAPNCSGFMSTGPQQFEAYRNNGSGSFVDYGFPVTGTKAVRQVAFGDIDGDGSVDVFVPDAANGAHLLFLNDGGGIFTNVASTHLPGGFTSRAGATEFADVDGDGDLDLFVGDSYSTAAAALGHILINNGSGVFSLGPTMPTGPGDDPIDVDFADVDRDWDLDIVLNMHLGKSLLWLNDGSGAFTDATANVHAMDGFHYGPSLCDIDGDLDLDMWTDNAGPGLADTLATNNGAGVFTDMTSTLVSGNPSNADDNGVICVDVDHDGDFDAAIPSLFGRERVLFNDNGSFTYNAADPKFPSSSNDNTLWLDFGDLNGDGRIDAVTALGEPSGTNKVYLANANMAIDTTAPAIMLVQQVVAADEVETPVVRFAVSDAIVTDTGPRLSRAYVKLDGANEVEAHFAGGDILFATLPAAPNGTTVSYEACAIDIEGNQACSPDMTYVVGQSGVGGGGQGGAGQGGAGAGVGGATGVGGGGTGGSSGDEDDDVEVDDGCGCRTAGGAGGKLGWGLALAGAAIWMSRRRRG